MESKKAHLCVMCLFISVSDNTSKGLYLFKTPNINSLFVFYLGCTFGFTYSLEKG